MFCSYCKLCTLVLSSRKVLDALSNSAGNEMQKLGTHPFVMLWIIVEIIAIRDTIPIPLLPSLFRSVSNAHSLSLSSEISTFMRNCLILTSKITNSSWTLHKKTKIHLSSQILIVVASNSMQYEITLTIVLSAQNSQFYSQCSRYSYSEHILCWDGRWCHSLPSARVYYISFRIAHTYNTLNEQKTCTKLGEWLRWIYY